MSNETENQKESFVKNQHRDFSLLLPPSWKEVIKTYISDDIPTFDYGGFVVGEKLEIAHLLCKSSGIFAGKPFFQAVFDYMDCSIEWYCEEGDYIDINKIGVTDKKFIVAKVTGKVKDILMGERTGLNILARASGIATAAYEAYRIKEEHKWHGEIAATRKVTPGFRMIEKYACLVGGISTHRLDLSQMIMLKDNHIWSVGSITNAVKLAKKAGGFSVKIEVECRTLAEAKEAAIAGADIVMLDNYTPAELKIDAKLLKEEFPHIIVEASGGITIETMSNFFSPYVDVISRGNFTQGYGFVDYSLKIQK